mmetsp:Transcript_15418/g.32441  ORF Transcript_15418/g.32441 Transcript_15418/m.32441 type:complete len:322 (+) Transcript_15418:2935-3900(+)
MGGRRSGETSSPPASSSFSAPPSPLAVSTPSTDAEEGIIDSAVELPLLPPAPQSAASSRISPGTLRRPCESRSLPPSSFMDEEFLLTKRGPPLANKLGELALFIFETTGPAAIKLRPRDPLDRLRMALFPLLRNLERPPLSERRSSPARSRDAREDADAAEDEETKAALEDEEDAPPEREMAHLPNRVTRLSLQRSGSRPICPSLPSSSLPRKWPRKTSAPQSLSRLARLWRRWPYGSRSWEDDAGVGCEPELSPRSSAAPGRPLTLTLTLTPLSRATAPDAAEEVRLRAPRTDLPKRGRERLLFTPDVEAEAAAAEEVGS